MQMLNSTHTLRSLKVSIKSKICYGIFHSPLSLLNYFYVYGYLPVELRREYLIPLGLGLQIIASQHVYLERNKGNKNQFLKQFKNNRG